MKFRGFGEKKRVVEVKGKEGLLKNPNPRNGVSSVRFCVSAFVLSTL